MSASIPQLITQSLTDDPQSSNEIHARLQTILGEGAPGLASVQSVLSQKGDTLGVKIRISKGIVRTCAIRERVAIAAAAEAEVAAAAAAAPAKRCAQGQGQEAGGHADVGGIKKPAKGGGKRSAKEKAAARRRRRRRAAAAHLARRRAAGAAVHRVHALRLLAAPGAQAAEAERVGEGGGARGERAVAPLSDAERAKA